MNLALVAFKTRIAHASLRIAGAQLVLRVPVPRPAALLGRPLQLVPRRVPDADNLADEHLGHRASHRPVDVLNLERKLSDTRGEPQLARRRRLRRDHPQLAAVDVPSRGEYAPVRVHGVRSGELERPRLRVPRARHRRSPRVQRHRLGVSVWKVKLGKSAQVSRPRRIVRHAAADDESSVGVAHV